MRDVIKQLCTLGPLPDIHAEIVAIAHYEELLREITPPVTDEEAMALTMLFGPDDCYGLAWMLLHLIETAPGWPIEECLKGNGEWIERLRRRVQNARQMGYLPSK